MNKNNHIEFESRDIGIWLDDYNDMFSDFDPRPYADRALSDDFISELKKVCNESEYKVREFNLLIPEKVRNVQMEEVVVKRIEVHIKRHYQKILERKKTIRKRSYLMIFIGLLCMAIASYIHKLQAKEFVYTVLIICFEPAGWFLVWTGLDDLLSITKRKTFELDFYYKLHNCKINFRNSE
ncbi:MAG: hypothetical protein Q8M29_06695 [Bacteroidota bacterium]|nr:hypothetical protein [Bacteroidota bacterium]